jgi:coenzyme PQQ precursor peptide PqqA
VSPDIVARTLESGGRGMRWKTPKVIEICVGMEINSYAGAEL